jgi:hypothetical protein
MRIREAGEAGGFEDFSSSLGFITVYVDLEAS